MEKASILKKKSDARKNKTRAQRVNPNAARKELLAKKLGRKGKRGMDEPETREVATASSRHAPTGAQISAPAGRCHGGGRERPRDISPESDAETTTTASRSSAMSTIPLLRHVAIGSATHARRTKDAPGVGDGLTGSVVCLLNFRSSLAT